MSNPVKRIVLEQFDNPRYCHPVSGVERSEKNSANHIYVVRSLKNLLSPVVTQQLLPSEVEKLIEDGVDVSIGKP